LRPSLTQESPSDDHARAQGRTRHLGT
jgi:hypothetical protein